MYAIRSYYDYAPAYGFRADDPARGAECPGGAGDRGPRVCSGNGPGGAPGALGGPAGEPGRAAGLSGCGLERERNNFV